ncbi:HK97 family phage prohead protease [Variovorax sp. RT4R15]|uniref:HK97 family phage prohead protease n=1 Tax=Variovorax sp. RT4R15 TaxID=3443737 RepID=UPI003F49023F
MEFKTLKLTDAQIKFASDKPTFTGYASVFGGVDDYGDTMRPGAFTKAISANGGEVKMYFNHLHQRRELPIGKMFLEQDDHGLLVKHAEFTPGLKMAEDVLAAVRHGTIDGLSIGYGLRPTGYKKSATGREIHEIEYLKEVSIVDYPADESARIIDVKCALDECASLKEIETLLREAGGFSRADATSLVGRIKTLARGDHDAEVKAAMEVRDLFASFRT